MRVLYVPELGIYPEEAIALVRESDFRTGDIIHEYEIMVDKYGSATGYYSDGTFGVPDDIVAQAEGDEEPLYLDPETFDTYLCKFREEPNE